MKYPAIIYNRSYEKITHADNLPYIHQKRYTVMVVDYDPDSTIPDRIAEIPTASFDRSYTADNLHHTVYTIYY